MFLLINTLDGRKGAIKTSELRMIEEAPDEIRKEDFRAKSIVTVQLAPGKVLAIPVTDKFETLMSSFKG